MAEYLHGLHSRSPQVNLAHLALDYSGPLHSDDSPDTTEVSAQMVKRPRQDSSVTHMELAWTFN
jgi:hypothetical protein